MIPFIRSLSELKALTEYRDNQKNLSRHNESYKLTVDSGKRKQYLISLDKEKVELPNLPKIIRDKWIRNKKSVSRFIDELDYNNQIQSSYDLTLIERQNERTQKDVA
tara:strand:- start:499 stop:819 length:321 start_codon:yes stop_codon:yes gene_type:complete